MDAIRLLTSDHRDVEQLFSRFDKLGPRARKQRAAIAEEIVEKLVVHSGIEETVFYPRVRAEVEGIEDEILEDLEEHHVAKLLLAEIDSMSIDDERFTAKVTVLGENIRHHIREEEKELFPTVRRQLTRERLVDLGEALEAARAIAPRRPHPHAPDTPPANLVVTAMTMPLDIAGRAVRRAIRASGR